MQTPIAHLGIAHGNVFIPDNVPGLVRGIGIKLRIIHTGDDAYLMPELFHLGGQIVLLIGVPGHIVLHHMHDLHAAHASFVYQYHNGGIPDKPLLSFVPFTLRAKLAVLHCASQILR
ncbi:hypothetical protein SDC9_136413 [bioreactor metagenome]|uniref:Uncharacterized protein n=1 Tax=bioreactor metagenome TaxID=1076179 RepID=A0A645DIJ3_9ZZZZ